MTKNPLSSLRPILSNRPLYFRFVVLVLILTVPFSLYIFGSIRYQEIVERSDAEEQTLSMARLVAARLDDRISQMDSLIGTVAAAVSEAPQDRLANSAFLQRASASFPSFVNNIAIWDKEGNNLSSRDPSLTTRSFRIFDRAYFQDALKNHGALAIEAPVVSRSNGEYVAQFAKAIVDAHGQVVGVVSASTRLRELQALVQPEGLNSDTLVSILDPRGVILARSINPAFWIGKSVANSGTFNENLGVSEAVRERVGVDGVERLNAFSAAHRAPWRVFVGIPTEIVFEPAHDHLRDALIAGLSLLTLSLLFGALLGRSVTRPIQALAEDARLFGRGELLHRSKVAGSPELRDLALAMNWMASSLKKRSEQLQRSEAWLRDITDSVPALIAYVNAEGVYQFANRHYSDLFQLDPKDMLGKTAAQIYKPEIAALLAPKIALALQGESVNFDYEICCCGRQFHLQANYLPDFNVEGAVQGFFLLDQDVTELQTAARLLEENEARTRAITENVPLLIGYLNREHRLTFANEAFARFAKKPLAEIVDQTFESTFGPIVYRANHASFERALAGEVIHFERLLEVDGQLRVHDVTYTPDRDALGTVRGFYGMSYDITELKKTQEALDKSRSRLRAITDNLPALVCYIDKAHYFRFNNRTYEKWLQLTLGEITDRHVAEVYGAEVYAKLLPALQMGLSGERSSFEVDFTGHDGAIRIARGTYIPNFLKDGTVDGVYGLISDVTNLKRAEEKLRILAQVDALTGLPNRRHFTERLIENIAAAEKAGTDLALLFIDIDRFKTINDTYGHETGDEVLIEFAARMSIAVRPSDTVGRLGGDEFVVVLSSLNKPEEIDLVARKIMAALKPAFKIHDTPLVVTASIGAALKRRGETDSAHLLRRADGALYSAKDAGRNTFRVAP